MMLIWIIFVTMSFPKLAKLDAVDGFIIVQGAFPQTRDPQAQRNTYGRHEQEHVDAVQTRAASKVC